MGRALSRMFVVCLVLANLTACAANTFYVSDKIERGKDMPAIVVMPVDIQLSELTMVGLTEVNASWTTQATQFLGNAVRDQLIANNIRHTPFSSPGDGVIDADVIDQLQRLHGLVGNTIATHYVMPQARLPHKGDRFDWTLGEKASELGRLTGANYALFLFVRDSYASPGRVAMIVAGAFFGVGIPGGVQVGYASLVDLKTGNIVWYNRLMRGVGDLRTQVAAAETAAALLDKMPK